MKKISLVSCVLSTSFSSIAGKPASDLVNVVNPQTEENCIKCCNVAESFFRFAVEDEVSIIQTCINDGCKLGNPFGVSNYVNCDFTVTPPPTEENASLTSTMEVESDFNRRLGPDTEFFRLVGCNLGRDFRFLGGAFQETLEGFRCDNGEIDVYSKGPFGTIELRARNEDNLFLTSAECEACCAKLDAQTDQLVKMDRFTASACGSACNSRKFCFGNSDRNQDKLGCAIAMDFLLHGQTLFDNKKVLCDSGNLILNEIISDQEETKEPSELAKYYLYVVLGTIVALLVIMLTTTLRLFKKPNATMSDGSKKGSVFSAPFFKAQMSRSPTGSPRPVIPYNIERLEDTRSEFPTGQRPPSHVPSQYMRGVLNYHSGDINSDANSTAQVRTLHMTNPNGQGQPMMMMYAPPNGSMPRPYSTYSAISNDPERIFQMNMHDFYDNMSVGQSVDGSEAYGYPSQMPYQYQQMPQMQNMGQMVMQQQMPDGRRQNGVQQSMATMNSGRTTAMSTFEEGASTVPPPVGHNSNITETTAGPNESKGKEADDNYDDDNKDI